MAGAQKYALLTSLTMIVSPLLPLARIEVIAFSAPSGGNAAGRSGRSSFFDLAGNESRPVVFEDGVARIDADPFHNGDRCA
jgi:hypothetical protein